VGNRFWLPTSGFSLGADRSGVFPTVRASDGRECASPGKPVWNRGLGTSGTDAGAVPGGGASADGHRTGFRGAFQVCGLNSCLPAAGILARSSGGSGGTPPAFRWRRSYARWPARRVNGNAPAHRFGGQKAQGGPVWSGNQAKAPRRRRGPRASSGGERRRPVRPPPRGCGARGVPAAEWPRQPLRRPKFPA